MSFCQQLLSSQISVKAPSVDDLNQWMFPSVPFCLFPPSLLCYTETEMWNLFTTQESTDQMLVLSFVAVKDTQHLVFSSNTFPYEGLQRAAMLLFIHHCSTAIYPNSKVVSKTLTRNKQAKKMTSDCNCGRGRRTDKPLFKAGLRWPGMEGLRMGGGGS